MERSMMRSLVLLCGVVTAARAPAALGQGEAAPPPRLTLTAAAPALSHSAAIRRADSTDLRMRRMMIRSATGAVGMLAGATAGFFGSQMLPTEKCACEDAGLLEALVGVSVGAFLGSAIGSALPRLDAHCKLPTRFGLALLGTAGGTLVGAFGVSAVGETPTGAMIIGVSLPLGASFAQWKCS
jgi:hypothetical protein